METDARKRARAKYRETHPVEMVNMELPKGTRDIWKARAQSLGLSLTGYIVSLVNADLSGVPADLSGIPADTIENQTADGEP